MSAKDSFLAVYEHEHQTTMKVLRAFPVDRLDLKPTPQLKSAREMAWNFVFERELGKQLFEDVFSKGGPKGKPVEAPAKWEDVLSALEKAHREFGELVRKTSDEQLRQPVTFFVAPRTMGELTRMDAAWMLLHDQIHHRGQLTVYLRMAGGIVPSIYGPTLEDSWR